MFLRRVGFKPWDRKGEIEFGDESKGWRFRVVAGYDEHVSVIVWRGVMLGGVLDNEARSVFWKRFRELVDEAGFLSRVYASLNFMTVVDSTSVMALLLLVMPAEEFCRFYVHDVPRAVSIIEDIVRGAVLSLA